jgi:hypothetical protein
MVPVYGVTMTWAAISNLLSGNVTRMVFAVLQVILAFSTFRRWVLLRRCVARLATPEPSNVTLETAANAPARAVESPAPTVPRASSPGPAAL